MTPPQSEQLPMFEDGLTCSDCAYYIRPNCRLDPPKVAFIPIPKTDIVEPRKSKIEVQAFSAWPETSDDNPGCGRHSKRGSTL